jgi:hypothetical protein
MNNVKEKAKELVDKFYQTTPNEAWINEPLGLSQKYTACNQAKECALISVDEILKVAFYSPPDCYNFYLNVKIELSNL